MGAEKEEKRGGAGDGWREGGHGMEGMEGNGTPVIAALSWSFAMSEENGNGVVWSSSERWRGWAMGQPKSWERLLDGIEAFKWPGSIMLLASPRDAGSGGRGAVNLSLDPSYQLLEIMVGNPGPMSGWIHRDQQSKRAWMELEGAFEGLERVFEAAGCELILRAPTRENEGSETLRVAGGEDARAWRAAFEARELARSMGEPEGGGDGSGSMGRL